MPAVSIIVPIYNGKKYIHRCIDSILGQSFCDFELIIVDDGSNDGSEKICDDYATVDSRVHTLHQKNGGVSNARNTGLGIATSEYIVFCDGDDYFRNDLLEATVKEMNATKADIVSFQLKRLSIDGVKRDAQVALYRDVDLTKARESFLEDVVSWKTGGWQACRSIFRRDIIQEHNIRFCESCHNYAEDLGFTLEFLLYARKIVFIDEQLYIYDDLRESSMMNTSRKKCRVSDVNEVSSFLNKKMEAIISEPARYRIHHQMILNEIGQLYGCTDKKDFVYWDEEVKKILDLHHFMELNQKYYDYTYFDTRRHNPRSQKMNVDRYLADLDLDRLLRAYRIRKMLLLCSAMKGKLLGK